MGMNYSPKGMYIWDAWYMVRDDQVHMYHLQRKRPGLQGDQEYEDWLGHSVSSDLINWRQCEPALGPDMSNPDDDLQLWTGSAIWHQGKGYLFYTMRGSRTDSKVQAIGLAISDDANTWHRYPGNPILRPDEKTCAQIGYPIPDLVDCRDFMVIKAPERLGWYGYYATRVGGNELPQTSAIACAYSDDLIHWEHLGPVFMPEKYACVEVPEVFELNGHWYMLCLTGNIYGNRGAIDDPNVTEGTIYAVADNPRGPFVEPEDNVLIGARFTPTLCCRTVLFNDRRYILYTDRERRGRSDCGEIFFGTITTPKILNTAGKRLYIEYCPLVESLVTDEPINPQSALPDHSGNEISVYPHHWKMPSAKWACFGDKVEGKSETGWGVYCLNQLAESFILEATVTIESGVAAGLAIRFDGKSNGGIVVLDASERNVFYGEAMRFDFIEQRKAKIEYNKPLHFKVVNRLEHVEVYVDNELRLAFGRYNGIGSQVGLFVDRANASFENVSFKILDITKPD